MGDPNDKRNVAGEAESVFGPSARLGVSEVVKDRASVARVSCIHRDPGTSHLGVNMGRAIHETPECNTTEGAASCRGGVPYIAGNCGS